MKSIQTGIRVDGEVAAMMKTIDSRPTTAAQIALEVFTWLRRATLHELKGRFTREEILALADSFKGTSVPSWQIMCNTGVLVAHTEDAEKYQFSASNNGADINTLLDKLRLLTTAQTTILQLELWSFWYRPEKTPVLDDLIKTLL